MTAKSAGSGRARLCGRPEIRNPDVDQMDSASPVRVAAGVHQNPLQRRSEVVGRLQEQQKKNMPKRDRRHKSWSEKRHIRERLYRMSTEKEPTGSSHGLVGEMLRKESENRLRDKVFDINNNALIHGDVDLDKAMPFIWAFSDPGANYLEPGTHYYADFIGRVLDRPDRGNELALLAWRPSGSQDDYQRIAKLATVPIPRLKLVGNRGGTLDYNRFRPGDRLRCSARVTLSYNSVFVHFQIEPNGLQELREEEVANEK
jgi:hypothetical protein